MKNSSLGKCPSNDIKKKGYKITTIIHLKIIIEENTSYYLQVINRRFYFLFYSSIYFLQRTYIHKKEYIKQKIYQKLVI